MQPQNTNYPNANAYGAGQPTQAFADPTMGAGSALKIRNLEGRTVVFVPTSYNPTAKGMNPTDPPRPTVSADCLVLDGGTLNFGDNATTGQSFTQRVAVPYYATGLLIGNSEIVRALVDHVGKGIVLGRVVRGTQGNRPWLLEKLAADDPARELAAQVWSARTLGTFINPTPTPLMPQSAPVGQHAPAAAQSYAYPQASPPTTYGQPSAAPNAYVPSQPAGAGNACPPGWQPAVWATLPPVQQQQVLQGMQAQQQPVGPTPGTGMDVPTGF